jgi:hypothetical protein
MAFNNNAIQPQKCTTIDGARVHFAAQGVERLGRK